MVNGINNMPTAVDATTTAPDGRSTADELALLFPRLVRTVRRRSTETGLSSAAVLTLHRLLVTGPQRMGAMAEAEGLTRSAITQMVGRLEREGYVRKTSADDDGRGVVVEATEAGREFVAGRRTARTALFEQLVEQLDPCQRAALSAALPALHRLADADD